MREALTILLAAFFTFGCITIHELRGHAREMTRILAVTAACLVVLVGVVAMAERPVNTQSRKQTVPVERRPWQPDWPEDRGQRMNEVTTIANP